MKMPERIDEQSSSNQLSAGEAGKDMQPNEITMINEDTKKVEGF